MTKEELTPQNIAATKAQIEFDNLFALRNGRYKRIEMVKDESGLKTYTLWPTQADDTIVTFTQTPEAEDKSKWQKYIEETQLLATIAEYDAKSTGLIDIQVSSQSVTEPIPSYTEAEIKMAAGEAATLPRIQS